MMTHPVPPAPDTYAGDASRPETKPSIWQKWSGAILLAALSALLIFIVSVTADIFLLRDHQSARLTVEVSDAISSVVIGLLAYKVFRLQQQRREYVRHRVEIIADMNHHVRNALQVISLTTHGSSTQEIRTIRESVNRIQWALRELLPKI